MSLDDRIDSGQTLGAMSEGQGDPLPVFYLELRRDGTPIDPGLVLRKALARSVNGLAEAEKTLRRLAAMEKKE